MQLVAYILQLSIEINIAKWSFCMKFKIGSFAKEISERDFMPVLNVGLKRPKLVALKNKFELLE